jgi:hypothetical protein
MAENLLMVRVGALRWFCNVLNYDVGKYLEF